ncbi:MAG: diacylglycerol kinase [Hydrocarboniphaga sp.]|uniref:NAD(P)H-dependent amine dehydrogenase family protein n=1 Tax=Hydrocarboniphaga sp. TaxID=2033016 RepID=UPI0026125DDD|nr:hypothetical protein [Hydrocarboniphaga sp.]MDB5968495.1 diacylglycerol kinase [Hydrocarboniphaga sp.]
MAYRVVLWGTGIVGAHAVAGIIEHPDLELVGVWVSSAAKSGRDVGDIAGLGRKLGLAATNDAETLLALKPDCIVHAAASDNRPFEAVADLERFLRAGSNVVSTGPVSALWPAQGEDFGASLHKTALAAGKTVWVNGIDPGFANDFLPMAITGLCRRVDKVHCTEIFNYSGYLQPDTLRAMGFGEPADSQPMLAMPGILTMAFGGGLRQIAAGLGIKLDSIEESCVRAFAPEDFMTAIPIKKGTGAGIRFKIAGMHAGREVCVIEHVTRMRDDIAPEWPQPSDGDGYRVSVTGEPSFTLNLQMGMKDNPHDHVNAACLATAMRIINGVPAVVQARPGHISIYDLPLLTGRVSMR